MLNEARSQLGYVESATGYTKYGAWYAASVAKDQAFADANYCDMGVSWAASQVGLDAVVGKFAFTPWHASWFFASGQWGPDPQPGKLVFYSWSGDLTISGIEHVGLVESVRSDGSLVTIEFNTTQTTGSGGLTGVYRRVRNPAGVVVGFGAPAYPPAPPADDGEGVVFTSLGAK